QQLTFEDTADTQPRISPDGTMLAWLGNRDNEENLWVRSLTDPYEARVLTERRRIDNMWWEAGSRTLLVSGNWDGETLSLRRISAVDGSVSSVNLPVDFGRGETGGRWLATGMISLSLDERFSVYLQTEMIGNLWVLEAETQD
ncbi:MAG: PD40 domain-containing protein, partial [Acidobacteria bacterium]|nr:PD40 domain-containing protein [Acidobacteriota bacterium]